MKSAHFFYLILKANGFEQNEMRQGQKEPNTLLKLRNMFPVVPRNARDLNKLRSGGRECRDQRDQYGKGGKTVFNNLVLTPIYNS